MSSVSDRAARTVTVIGDFLRAQLSRLSPTRKSELRSLYFGLQKKLVDTFRSYGPVELRRALEDLGVRRGDTLMVHAGHSRLSGFKGRPSDVVDTLLDTVGSNGDLVMVSMAYTSSAHEYLKQRKPFDVRKTVSHMGMVSESFRRRNGVLRSMHPSNPVLAFGPRAAWIVEGHENCRHPCGAGSPFEKLAELRAKVLFLDATIYTQTFFHYLEDMVADQLDFPLFRDELVEATVIDYDGSARTVQTYTYSDEVIRRRRPDIMVAELNRLGLIRKARVGNSRILLLHTEQVVRVVRDMASRGVFFYSK
jgi:aminoglycoside 3-N-acetyltransferase